MIYHHPGVHECLVRSIMKADLDLRKTFFQQIVLAGGSTMFPGFGDRLLNEVRKLAPRDVKIRISAPPERKYSTWIGGCVASTRDFEEGPLYHGSHLTQPLPIPTRQVDPRLAGHVQVAVGHAAGAPGARCAHRLEAHAVMTDGPVIGGCYR